MKKLLFFLSCIAGIAMTVHAGFGQSVITRSGSMSIQTCINSAGTGGTCIVPGPYSETPSSGLTISADGVTLSCDPGVTLIATISHFLIVTGAGDTIEGCNFDGANIAHAVIDVASQASNFTFSNDTIVNSAKYGVYLENVSSASINNSTFTNNVEDAIYGYGNTTEVSVLNNMIDSSTSLTTWHSAIGFHSQTAGTAISNLTIQNNTIQNGSSFCIEVGAFGGNAPTNVTVSNNNCTQTAGASGFGGYSFDTVTSPNVKYNTYTNSTTSAPNLPGIELVNGTGAMSAHNTLVNGDMSVNKQSYTLVSSNSQTFSIQTGSGAIYVGTSGSLEEHDNTITGNMGNITFLSPSSSFRMVWVQCNTPSANCDNISITNNSFSSTNLITPDAGIHIENDFPASAHINNLLVDSNYINNWNKCYVQSSSGVSGTVTNFSGSCIYP